MYTKLTFLLCVILSIFCITLVQAVPSRATHLIGHDTNAQRIRRGLPPMAPKIKRHGTPVAAAKRHFPSNSPPKTYTGYIRVKKNGNNDGWVKRNFNPSDFYTTTNGNGNRVTISFTAAASGTSSQIEIKDTYNNRFTTPFIGGAGTTISATSNASVKIAGVAHTTGGAGPTNGSSTTSNFPTSIESAIWQYNAVTGALTAVWKNSDGSTPPAYIVYDPNNTSDGGLYLTGNVNLFRSSQGHNSAYEVTLTFVSTP